MLPHSPRRRGGMLLVHSAALVILFSTMGTAFRVVVVGGTHGNEYTGVWCCKHLQQTTAVETLIGNPAAVAANRRFIDTDLNRQFRHQDLNSPEKAGTTEGQRARELNTLLGPKGSKEAADWIIDLHSTTANMGLCLIVTEGNPLVAQAAAYVVQNMPNARILVHAADHDRPNVCSIAENGLTIEVGPVPQGVVRHDAVEKTLEAVKHAMDFIKNRPSSSLLPTAVPCFQSAPATSQNELSGRIQWPTDSEFPNFPRYMIHKDRQDSDFCRIQVGDPLFVDSATGEVIPYSGSHGDSVYLIFVNEGGYYYPESGTGIGVAIASSLDVATGTVRVPAAIGADDTFE